MNLLPHLKKALPPALKRACAPIVTILLAFAVNAPAEELEPPELQSPTNWANFVEPNFPFFSSVLDARSLGPDWPTNNLTPRALILNLSNNCWACFDTELLRLSVAWQGQSVTAISLSQGSYHRPGKKTGEGQVKLPKIVGEPWCANGIYPGWQASERPAFNDPRDPGPDLREVGRGPLPGSLGQVHAVRLTDRGAALEYEVAGVVIRELVESRVENGQLEIRRSFHLGPNAKTIWLVLGKLAPGIKIETSAGPPTQEFDGLIALKIKPSSTASDFTVAIGKAPSKLNGSSAPLGLPQTRWPQSVTGKIKPSQSKDAYVVDGVPLPLNNPWKRNVRLADIAFFSDGRAAVVTFDGDVWIISGVGGESHWQRFTSGLHEPLSLGIRDETIFVFDRNGIWRLRDTDNNGEADVHELVSNAFAQTAETREFANGMKLAPDGSFVVAKGGQQSSTLGKDNGTVLRIAPDGKSYQVIGWGLRQPFIGIHPKAGLVTASDQQGHYVPATPIHIIRDHHYYGFLASALPKEKYPAPIADPWTWIPHAVNASGAGQAWLTDAKMGPLNDALIHIGYGRPELFLVCSNSHSTSMQAAVVSLTQQLEFAPLNGSVNPADGQLYVAGFQIWGSTAKRTSGLARIRYTGAASTLPREIAPMDKGLLLRFDTALDPAFCANATNFVLERWNYKRTSSYGSPHYKLDGNTGQDWMSSSSAYVSLDAKSIFIGVPDMRTNVNQMRLSWKLKTRAGHSFEQTAYLTPYELAKFDPAKEGFAPLTVDLTPRKSRAAATPVTVAEGERLASVMGCAACHSPDGTTAGKVGPTWKGLFGLQREFKEGEPAIADAAYIHESILEPTAKIVKGFEKSDAGMPSYAGVLTEPQIQAIILYIQSLK